MGYVTVSENQSNKRDYDAPGMRVETGVYVARLVYVKPVQRVFKGVQTDCFRLILATTRVMAPDGESFMFVRDISTKYNDSEEYKTLMTELVLGAFGKLITRDECITLGGEEPNPPLEHLFGYEFNVFVEYMEKFNDKAGKKIGYNNVERIYRPHTAYLDYNHVMSTLNPWWVTEKAKRAEQAAAKGQNTGGYKSPEVEVDPFDEPAL